MAEGDLELEDTGKPASLEDDIMRGIDDATDDIPPEGEGDDAKSATQDAGRQTSLPLGEGDGKTGKAPGKAKTGPQDLVDSTGAVIAKGGAERRFYETAQREKKRADDATRQFEALSHQLEGFKQASAISTQLGLSPEEAIAGSRIIAAYKEDPVKTIEYLLTQAKAAGHNVETLGGQSVDMAAIKRLIETQLAPLAEDRQKRQAAEQAEAGAQQKYDEFVAKYPDAVIHGDSIARLIERDPSLSPDAAYWRLKAIYAENGLDFSKPLSQIETEQGATSKPQSSLPSGRPRSGAVAQGMDELASVDTPYEDIIRQGMKEAGITQ